MIFTKPGKDWKIFSSCSNLIGDPAPQPQQKRQFVGVEDIFPPALSVTLREFFLRYLILRSTILLATIAMIFFPYLMKRREHQNLNILFNCYDRTC